MTQKTPHQFLTFEDKIRHIHLIRLTQLPDKMFCWATNQFIILAISVTTAIVYSATNLWLINIKQ